MKKFRSCLKICLPAALVLLTAACLRIFVFTLVYVPSDSMYPTIKISDTLLCTYYDADEINRYDIIVFEPPIESERGKLYIKRVLGLPGEEITVRNGHAYVNGVQLDSSFTNDFSETDGDGVYQVPAGCYFVMGDNRDRSFDSRYWDNHYVSQNAVIAKAKLVIYPFSRFGSVVYK